MSGTRNNGFNLLEALAALLQAGQPSAADVLLMDEKFEPNPETEKTFKDALKEINEIDPSKVMGFFVTVVYHNDSTDSEPCPGCGEFHESGNLVFGGVGGERRVVRAAVLSASDRAGLV